MEGTRGVRRIELANATTLPWLDESVDAIVTDPPYYDSIPYTDISSFYWTWERAILGTDSIDLATPAESLEVADGTDGYEAQLGRALEEFHRVLKQGRTLCLFLTTRTDTALARYVDLSQTAGFEFFISYRVNDYERGSLVRDNPKTYLLLLRKPFALSFAAPAAVETRRVIEVGTTLYAGLAEKLLQVLGDDVAELLPQNARGARVEVLMEVLAEGDVRALLRQALGLAGIRQLAAAIPLPVTGEPPETVLNAILEYFGFAIPGPIPGGGPSQVARDLRLAIVGLKNTRDFDRVTSEVLRVARSVESLLHRTVFSWTHLIFGERRDIVLSEILRAARADVTLDRLSFGHVLRLWRELPQRISEEQLSDEIQAKFGGRYPYELRSDAKPIEQLVTIRNDVAHHKVAASGSDFEKWHSKALAVCERVQEGLTVLVERRALIRIAVPMSISAPSETTVCSVFGAC
jgi:hypothetical protein